MPARQFAANLEAAWAKVFSRGGAAGGDGVTLGRFLVNVHARLARLRALLVSGEYMPGPIRRLDIPKDDGGTRPLAIPSVIDRVAQTAVNLVLAPLIDAEFGIRACLSRRALGAGRGRGAFGRSRRRQWLLVETDIDGLLDNVRTTG